MENTTYDAVIVGAGISGAIVARELAGAGHSVLVVEAGDSDGKTWDGYQTYVQKYYNAEIKTPNSPYPDQKYAPAPSVLNFNQITSPPPVDTPDYFIQMGPEPFGSNYNRNMGGTTLHWLGTCLRMLPSDFRTESLYGKGRDWPISYGDLEPFYEQAEFEIGVSADVSEQKYLGLTFPKDYVYPMSKIPQSYLDRKLRDGIAGMSMDFEGRSYPLEVVSTPQGRNSMPNREYINRWKKPFNNIGERYRPVGAVGNQDMGQRCEGNSSCVPICPVQAKYNGIKTLEWAKQLGAEVTTRSVVSRIIIDKSTDRVSGVQYTVFGENGEGPREHRTAHGRVVILSAHAAENAKILLSSNAANSSDQVGRNLMDHPTMLTWGSMPEDIGANRGPGSTSGIPSLRDGDFRRNRAAFRIEIGNWGWNWPAGTPYSTVSDLVTNGNLFGRELRRELHDQSVRQFRFGFLVEQPPDPRNRVTINPSYRDAVGNVKPVIHYHITDYVRAGFKAATEVSNAIFQRVGATNGTVYNPAAGGYVTYDGQGYWYQGAGHLAGTHIMGSDNKTSVVDKWQRSWDHKNLFLVGCGSMPNLATSNPTLTMAAMAFMSSTEILRALND